MNPGFLMFVTFCFLWGFAEILRLKREKKKGKTMLSKLELEKKYGAKEEMYAERDPRIVAIHGKTVKVVFPTTVTDNNLLTAITYIATINGCTSQAVLNSGSITIDGKPRKLTKMIAAFTPKGYVDKVLLNSCGPVELKVTCEYEDILAMSESTEYSSCYKGSASVLTVLKDPNSFLLVQVNAKTGEYSKRIWCTLTTFIDPETSLTIEGIATRACYGVGKKVPVAICDLPEGNSLSWYAYTGLAPKGKFATVRFTLPEFGAASGYNVERISEVFNGQKFKPTAKLPTVRVV